MGTTHRSSWYAEHHETTQCKYIADEFASNKSFKWQRQVCTSFTNSAKKRNDCVWDPVTNKKTLTITRSKLLSKKGKVFVTGPYNAKKALIITGASFSEKETGDIPSCDSKLLGEGDSLMVVWCSPHVHTLRTQDERLLNYTIKTDETKQSCQPRFRNRRPARVMVMGVYHKTTLANIAMIVAGTSSHTKNPYQT